MNRRTVLAQLAVFAVIAVLIVGYTLFDLLGVHVTNQPFTMTVQLPTGGGIFDGAEVSYRGVQVGRVRGVHLETSQVTVKLAIDHGKNIPDNAVAHVYDLSAVGEQYIDLVPTGPSSTYLHSGSVIPAERTTTPLQTATVLYDLERFVDSVNPADVRIIGTEGAAAFSGIGPQMKALLDDATSIISQLAATTGPAIDLIHQAATILHGAAAHSAEFAVFANAANQLTSTLASSTPTLSTFLQQSPGTVAIIDSVVKDNGSAIVVLLGNLATLGQIQVARIPGLKSLLVAVPEFGTLAPTIVSNGALLAAGDLNYTSPDCPTGVPLSNPISGTRTAVRPVSCTVVNQARGAANAPRPGGSTTASVASISGYDPNTGLSAAPDGSAVQLGSTGGQAELLGPNSWQALLMAGVQH
jgi:phospholipid/cholesterol/gamma-HCH transport system substrate-binding protein